MSYEAGIDSGVRAGAGRFGTADARYRQPTDFIGRAYEPRPGMQTGANVAVRAIVGLFQLTIPVLLLMALGAVCFLFGDRPVTWFGTGAAEWLSQGHLIVPLTFFAIALTSRRYGAAHAFAQVLIAWAVGIALLWTGVADLPLLAGRPLPPVNVITGFGAGLFLAQLFSVAVFDWTRGPRWWSAPLLALLFGGLLLSLIAFPLAYIGTPVEWFGRLGVYAGVLSASAVLLLLPYWLLRSLVPPQSGFGGY